MFNFLDRILENTFLKQEEPQIMQPRKTIAFIFIALAIIPGFWTEERELVNRVFQGLVSRNGT